jgi:hypothetical protein
MSTSRTNNLSTTILEAAVTFQLLRNFFDNHGIFSKIRKFSVIVFDHCCVPYAIVESFEMKFLFTIVLKKFKIFLGQYFNIKFLPMLLYILQMRWKKFNIKIYLWITLHIFFWLFHLHSVSTFGYSILMFKLLTFCDISIAS